MPEEKHTFLVSSGKWQLLSVVATAEWAAFPLLALLGGRRLEVKTIGGADGTWLFSGCKAGRWDSRAVTGEVLTQKR